MKVVNVVDDDQKLTSLRAALAGWVYRSIIRFGNRVFASG